MNETFLWTIKTEVTPAAARRCSKALRSIDPTASFERHNQPGSDLKGWVVRSASPLEGTTDRKETDAKLVETAKRILE